MHQGIEGHEHPPRRRRGRAADGAALRTLAWRAVLPVLLSMAGRVFPFEHGAAFVTTHSVAAAGPQRPSSSSSSSCPVKPVAFAHTRVPVTPAGTMALHAATALPNAAWPPAWARPHLKLATGPSPFRVLRTAGRALPASSLHSYAAPLRRQAVRPGVVALRASPPAGGGGFGRSGPGAKQRFGARRRFVGGHGTMLQKRVPGARSSFPSSRVSKTAPWMAKAKASAAAAASKTSTLTKKTGTKTTKAAGGLYSLVIVESPAKARTIQKFLDSQFVVESCMGHVRDLPQKAKDVPAELKGTFGKLLGVDADNGFAALYVTMTGKEPVIKKLKDRLKFASELILASGTNSQKSCV